MFRNICVHAHMHTQTQRKRKNAFERARQGYMREVGGRNGKEENVILMWKKFKIKKRQHD